MGAVYLVTDRFEGGKEKALKVLPALMNTPDVLERFKIEFEILAQLHHPNLEKVYDFEFDNDRNLHFFTAEYIPGTDFLTATEEVRFPDLVRLTVQVCRALAYLHARGIIHFDLKPGNILVSPDRSTIKLIDFGLAGATATELFGTPGYIAPEVLRGGDVDRRADLYCLGVVLYQGVTGRFPFQDTSTVSIIRRQLEEPPRAPGRLNPEIPRPLERVILKLLEKEPSDRFGSAQEVIHAINEGLGLDHEIETPSTATGYLLTARLIGRDGELGRLKELFKKSTRGETSPYGSVPSLVVLSGEPGVGKMRLVQELRWFAQLRGAAFIECAPETETGSALGFLSEAIRQLLALAGPGDPAMQTHGRTLGDLLLAPREPPSREPGASDAGGPPAVFGKIVRFAVQVSLRHPFVFLVKDLHALGAGPAAFLGDLVRSVNLWRREGAWDPETQTRARPKVMIVTTSDAGASAWNPQVQALLGSLDTLNLVERIGIEPLPAHHVEALVEAVVGSGPSMRAFAGILYRELGGNPLSLLEAMKFLLDEGVLSYGEKGWEVDLEAVRRPGGVPTMSKAIAIRTGQLPPSRREILEALAVLDEPAGFDRLTALLHIDREAFFREGKALEKAGFVRSDRETGKVRLALSHGKLREIVYGGLAEARHRELHARAAGFFEAKLGAGRNVEMWGRLAVHFSRSGESAKGGGYALRASDHFEKLRLYGEAVRFLQLALEHTEDPDEKRGIQIRLGSALCNGGDSKAARDLMIDGLALGEDPMPPGDVRRFRHTLARAYANLGRHEEALDQLRRIEARDRTGSPLPSSVYTLKANILTHLARYEEAQAVCEDRLNRYPPGDTSKERAVVLDCLAFLFRAQGNLVRSLERRGAHAQREDRR
jgi:tetratricopeptide (TPR) repeat protein